MKKVKCLFTIVVVLFACAIIMQSTEVKADSYVWAMKNYAQVPGFSWLDHTYACIDNCDQCYAISVYGQESTTSGGVPVYGAEGYLSYTDKIRSMCYGGCYMDYGINGVCHQNTNRVLYKSCTTLINSVRGYSTSRWMYGITGDVGPYYGRFSYCRDACGY